MIPGYNKKRCAAFLPRRESITGERTTSFPKKLQPYLPRDSNSNPLGYNPRVIDTILARYCAVAAVDERSRYRIVAVTSSSPILLKTRCVGQRCTLNLSRDQTSSRWCGVVVRRKDDSSGVIHVTCPWFKITWSVAKSPRVAEQCATLIFSHSQHGTGGEGNILQTPAPVVSAATTHKTFGSTHLTSTFIQCTRRVFGSIGHRTQVFRCGVQCSNPRLPKDLKSEILLKFIGNNYFHNLKYKILHYPSKNIAIASRGRISTQWFAESSLVPFYHPLEINGGIP
ncbi:uncharacterized protein TNCV_4951191 [Trichonephila clavipes]|nr:uncharacterized protein TNCV_4951191 [Trichonephila clavipes]